MNRLVNDVGLGAAVLLVIGLGACFFGYRLFKAVLGVGGFVLGAAVVGGVAYALTKRADVAAVAGVIGGFLGAAALLAVYSLGVFAAGASAGALLAIAASAGAQGGPEPAAVAILAVIGGIVALAVQKLMIVVSTAFGGAYAVATAVGYYVLDRPDLSSVMQFVRSAMMKQHPLLFAWLALGVAGVIVQYRSPPPRRSEPSQSFEDEGARA